MHELIDDYIQFIRILYSHTSSDRDKSKVISVLLSIILASDLNFVIKNAKLMYLQNPIAYLLTN